jgi:hypothetical protein
LARYKRISPVYFEILRVISDLDWDGVIEADIIEEVVFDVDVD